MTQGTDWQAYLDHPGVSRSHLVALGESPAYYRWWLENKRSDTSAMVMGRALHAAVFEPTTFQEVFVTAPKCDRRTKEGKAAWAEFLSASAGKEIMTAEEHDAVAGMGAALRNHRLAASLLRDGRGEASMFWAEDGRASKARIDWMAQGWLLELKSTHDATYHAFQRTAAQFEYHLQAAWYSRGVEAVTGEHPRGVVFLVVENKPPHRVAVYPADEEFLDRGADLVHERLRLLSLCEETGQWPDLHDGRAVSLSLPKWAR